MKKSISILLLLFVTVITAFSRSKHLNLEDLLSGILQRVIS